MAKLNFEAADQEQTWIGDSGEPGPTAVILGGVHGSEVSGTQVVDDFVTGKEKLSVDAGRVILIKGNPRAIEMGLRQTPDGGVNLNRQFRELTPEELAKDFKDLPYEVQRAQKLMPLLRLGESALDLHGFSREDGTPFIITERRGFAVAAAVGAPIISSGWSEIEPGGTDAFMETLDRIGVCYEVGWNGAKEEGRRRGLAATMRFLGAGGLVEPTGEPLYRDPRYIQAQQAVIARAGGLTMSRAYRSFEPLQTGEVVAVNGSTPVVAGENQVIIFPPGPDHLQMNEGGEAFNFGTRFDPKNDPFAPKS